MLVAAAIPPATRASLLGRTSPLVKLGLAIVWLFGLATTTALVPALVLVVAALAAALLAGAVRPRRLLVGVGPLVVAALAIALTNLLFSGSNADPGATEIARLGPLRVTAPALAAAEGLFARVLAIVAVGGVFALTTDPTRLVDSLVQQAHLPARFAYGALAAYQAVPRLSEDLATIRDTRRLRGLRSSWHPRVLVGLLVRAIRHADQLADAMDARAFGAGSRTSYRPIAWTRLDLVVAVVGTAILVAVLLLVR